MLHVSLLLFGAHDNQASRSPASAVLAVFLGTVVSLCSFQSGAYLARYQLAASLRRAPQPDGSSGSRALVSNRSGNTICAPEIADWKQPERSSNPCAKLETSSPTVEPAESVQAHATNGHATAIERRMKWPTNCTTLQQGLMSHIACLLVTSSVCLTLAAWLFSKDRQEWASFWLAGLLAPVGALIRWHLGALNSTPKSAPLPEC